MAKRDFGSLLTSVDELFTTQEERDETARERVIDIPLEQISDFPNHPFKVKMDEAMEEMTESVRQHGVLVPCMVRPREDGGYEMISGHRRKLASGLAEKDSVPCLVRDLSDDEAVIIMVDSNLQRESVLPSEKAFAYRMKLEAMKRQAGRPGKNNSVPLGQYFGMTSREVLAGHSPDSNTQIQRYIRLTWLIRPLLDLVDGNKIAMRPAVEVSYLPEEEQTMLFDGMERELWGLSHLQACRLRELSENGELTEAAMRSVMEAEKPRQKEQFKMPYERLSRYFSPGTSARTMEETIIKALEYYRSRENAGL